MKTFATLLICIAYVIWPIDFIPDFVPLVGWVDDLIAIIVGVSQLLAIDSRQVE